ncbi:MAG: thioredoxin domain-containing protein [Deltaproteobacteria bacterium]|nr:thioredoxin domain-containing protein [Deltaproteobacteria bacterium]
MPILIVVALLVAACGARSRATREGRETIARTGTVDLGRLTSAETLLLVDIVRTEASPCEGDLSLLETLEKPDPCARAMRALGFIYRHILEGYGREDVLDQYVARFKQAEAVKLDLEGCPDTGPEDAKVTITVFSDFMCPFCRKAEKVLMDLKEQRGDEVRIVFKHFPLTTLHPEAMNAALAAAAAHMQGRFWQMHDELFGLEVAIDPDAMEEAAQGAGLDMERWREDLESPEVLDLVNRDLKQAQDLHLEGTPTIFVDGMMYIEPLKYIDQVVEERLLVGD